jgi:hypothetical protein
MVSILFFPSKKLSHRCKLTELVVHELVELLHVLALDVVDYVSRFLLCVHILIIIIKDISISISSGGSAAISHPHTL